MGVRAIVVYKKKKQQHNMRIYFQFRNQRLFCFHVCCGCSTVVPSKAPSSNPHGTPLLWDGFPKKSAAFLPYWWLKSADTHDFVNERYFYKNI